MSENDGRMNAAALHTSETLIEAIAKGICESSGLEYSEKMRARVEVKLKRRVVELGLQNFSDYPSYYQVHEKSEFKTILAALTTQASHFFSEFSHFEYISNELLKTWVPHIRMRADKTLHVWSAACSQGQEVFSLAMYLKQALSAHGPDLQVQITGTDFDVDSIQYAQAGIYPRGEMRDVPLQFLGNDWERVTVNSVDMMRAKAALKNTVHFEVANLHDLTGKLPGKKFDLIFVRNVFLTFNESQIKASCIALLSRLVPDGHLVLGLTESLEGLDLPLKPCGLAIYQGQGGAPESVVPSVSTEAKALQAVSTQKSRHKGPIKVFCIDDSPAVHTLMRGILKKEKGFVILGNAVSLQDAQKQSKPLHDADVVTVNFQTSEENSIAYLERNLKDSHPPALIITSEIKNHTKLIELATKLGEFECIERPLLNHLTEQGQIIRAKLKTLFLNRQNNVLQFRGPDQFKSCALITNPAQKVRVVVGGMTHLRKISSYLRDLNGDQPPVYLFIEGMPRNLATVADEIKRLSGKNCAHDPDFIEKAGINEIRVYDLRKNFAKVADAHRAQKTSLAILGDLALSSSELVLSWKNAGLILEDLGFGEAAEFLKMHTDAIFPASGFAFLTSEQLNE
jgi:chemotaxis protein methyltransferase CheR